MITSGVVFITRVPYLTMGHRDWYGCATKTRVELVGPTSAVSAWNKKEETRAHCHDRTRPELAKAGNQRPSSEVFLEDLAAGGRTHAEAGSTHALRVLRSARRKGSNRLGVVAQSPAGSAYLVSAAEPNAVRSRSGKEYRTRGMPSLARTGNGQG